MPRLGVEAPGAESLPQWLRGVLSPVPADARGGAQSVSLTFAQ